MNVLEHAAKVEEERRKEEKMRQGFRLYSDEALFELFDRLAKAPLIEEYHDGFMTYEIAKMVADEIKLRSTLPDEQIEDKEKLLAYIERYNQMLNIIGRFEIDWIEKKARIERVRNGNVPLK